MTIKLRLTTSFRRQDSSHYLTNSHRVSFSGLSIHTILVLIVVGTSETTSASCILCGLFLMDFDGVSQSCHRSSLRKSVIFLVCGFFDCRQFGVISRSSISQRYQLFGSGSACTFRPATLRRLLTFHVVQFVRFLNKAVRLNFNWVHLSSQFQRSDTSTHTNFSIRIQRVYLFLACQTAAVVIVVNLLKGTFGCWVGFNRIGEFHGGGTGSTLDS